MPHRFTLTGVAPPASPCLDPKDERGKFGVATEAAYGRSAFCCAFLQLTLTGSYPAPCPVELRLSSRACAPAVPSASPSAARLTRCVRFSLGLRVRGWCTAVIVAQNLSRSFVLSDRTRGLAGALRDLVRRDGTVANAVNDVSFSIERGEAVALLGPNGAGKSTTVKMLCGILKPTGGTLRIRGRNPWAERTEHVRGLGVVFGQRTQLWWDLAVIEAFDLVAAMFGVSEVDYRARLRRMDELLGVGAFLRTPVRQLSLGERMRCELAAALLHAPALLILDEPTIGLDVAVKLRLRAFLAQLRDEGQTTIILTTHDLGDVAALCPRVLLLSGGKLLHDGSMAGLVRTLGGQRRVRVTLGAGGLPVELADFPGLISLSSSQVAVPVPPNTPDADILRKILALPGVADVVVEDDPLEALIARSYQS